MKSYQPIARPGSVFLFLIFLLGVAQAQTPSGKGAKPLRLFMIGNSFSQNASRYLPQLSKEGGHPLIIGRAEIGGSSLQRHWSHVEAAERDPADPNGKPYGGKSLKMLLSDGVWDVVTIQQASILSGDPATYRPYAQKLYDYVRKLQPNATVVIHQTWAYRSDSNDFSRIAEGDSADNAAQMWQKSRAAYHAIANELGLPIIPNGDAFWRVGSRSKWAYHRDPAYNFAQPQAPALPNQTHSLHVGYRWDGARLAFDSHHANAAGCYLGGLVWYGFLFNESPRKLTFRPAEVDESFARKLKKTAWSTVRRERRLAKSRPVWLGE
ncbi:DUF4886 domain-containing protein [Rudanella paleaurantiibacter]|uniref:DUF4886 domain-containing protein n=1 Tax=Rudanella paleaurantiibacter TaxID=2614655 RepID=A0A7J5TTL5_9BACT|nr:DUF4886 domain-containing protein [Rudanella paleaurantiibacter]KAB7727254.1 DUF4886 domain-containing protein [Rudanella paleaurantiibacter]